MDTVMVDDARRPRVYSVAFDRGHLAPPPHNSFLRVAVALRTRTDPAPNKRGAATGDAPGTQGRFAITS